MKEENPPMRKSLLLTFVALIAVTIFAFGCKKEENANTDTAATDTGVTSSSTAGTTATSATDTTGTGMMATDTTGTAGSMGTMGTMSTMATTGTETSGTVAPSEKKAATQKKKSKKH